MSRTVVIDCYPSSVGRYMGDHAIVAVDVVRATTMVVSAVASGRRCILASDVAEAFALHAGLGSAILAGEVRGTMPRGFDMNNSPAELEARDDPERALIVLSDIRDRADARVRRCAPPRPGSLLPQLGCGSAQPRVLSRSHRDRSGPGAATSSARKTRCAAPGSPSASCRLAIDPRGRRRIELIERWKGAPAEACDVSNSVAYLRRTGQLRRPRLHRLARQ